MERLLRTVPVVFCLPIYIFIYTLYTDAVTNIMCRSMTEWGTEKATEEVCLESYSQSRDFVYVDYITELKKLPKSVIVTSANVLLQGWLLATGRKCAERDTTCQGTNYKSSPAPEFAECSV
jgi:hypothetical protein